MNLFLYFSVIILSSYYKYTSALQFQLSNSTWKHVDPGEPLFLTNYIERGLIAEAKEKARVVHPALSVIESYAGYLSIDKKYNSHTWFWFFPSQRNPKDDPIVMWFIGGPGLTCLITVFDQSGPFIFTTGDTLETRKYSLTVNHSVIYFDNPVGTGFSFTESNDGYARNTTHTAKNTIAALIQFFKLFPEYKKNDFYLGGDSYGGKFVITTASAIKDFNDRGPLYINLKGLMLGNAVIDFASQSGSYEFYYQLGLVDKKGRDALKEYQTNPLTRFNQNGLEKLITELTGFTYYSNLMHYKMVYSTYFTEWIHSNEFRRAVHAGDRVFNFSSDVVREYFDQQIRYPTTKLLEGLLRYNCRVLVYNGQLDLIFSYTGSQKLYESLKWSNARKYKDTDRQQWWVDGQLAGYVKSAYNFIEVFIRNAGHVTFFEQPKWTCELLTRFTHKQPIVQEKNLELNLPVKGGRFVYHKYS